MSLQNSSVHTLWTKRLLRGFFKLAAVFLAIWSPSRVTINALSLADTGIFLAPADLLPTRDTELSRVELPRASRDVDLSRVGWCESRDWDFLILSRDLLGGLFLLGKEVMVVEETLAM